MKNLILFILVFLNLQLISCQQNTKKILKPKKSIEKLVTDSFFNQFYAIYGGEDKGLLQTGNYDPKRGYYEIYFISNIGAQKWLDELNKKGDYETEIKKINILSPKKISEKFDIWVFYTDKKYLVELEDGSPRIIIYGIIELYYLKSGTNEWKKIDHYNVKNEDDRIKSSDWKQEKLEEILSVSNNNILNSSTSLKISDKWIGKYSTYFSYGKLGEQEAGWVLDIEITKEKITVIGEGYQIGFTDLLLGREENNKLLLNYSKNLSGYSLGAKMNPEFELIKVDNKYFVRSNWIDNDIITKSEKDGYLIQKIE